MELESLLQFNSDFRVGQEEKVPVVKVQPGIENVYRFSFPRNIYFFKKNNNLTLSLPWR